MRVNLDRKTAKQMHTVYRCDEEKPLNRIPLAEMYPIKKACQIAEILVENDTYEYK